MQFYEFPSRPWTELLPKADLFGRDLVSKLVRYESGERLRASEVRKTKTALIETDNSTGTKPRPLQGSYLKYLCFGNVVSAPAKAMTAELADLQPNRYQTSAGSGMRPCARANEEHLMNLILSLSIRNGHSL